MRSTSSTRRRRTGGPSGRAVVCITGASGLIGTRLAQNLVPDYKVIGLDVKEPPESFPDAARFVACDLTSQRSTREAIQEIRGPLEHPIASVVHLAAYYDFLGEPSSLYEELTVKGTERLLRALQEGALPEQLLFSSSLLVMMPSEGEPLTESSPIQAEWAYPRSKLEAEAVLEKSRGEIPCVVLRLAGVYDEGGHSPPITQQIWRIRERTLESFLFPGDASRGQSFVHLDDAVRCIRAAIERRGQLPALDRFLVGEPDVMSYGELQDRIGELLHGHEWPTVRIPARLPKAGAWAKEATPLAEASFIKPWMIDLADAHYPIRIQRARTRLAWEPEHRIRDVLPRMIEQLQADPAAWYQENGLPIRDRQAHGGAHARNRG